MLNRKIAVRFVAPLVALGALGFGSASAGEGSLRLAAVPPRPKSSPRASPAKSAPVRAAVIKPAPAAPIAARQPIDPASAWGQVNVENVNVRSGPGTQHGILATLHGGDFVKARATQGGWLEIEWPQGKGAVAFISARYVITGVQPPAGASASPAVKPIAAAPVEPAKPAVSEPIIAAPAATSEPRASASDFPAPPVTPTAAKKEDLAAEIESARRQLQATAPAVELPSEDSVATARARAQAAEAQEQARRDAEAKRAAEMDALIAEARKLSQAGERARLAAEAAKKAEAEEQARQQAEAKHATELETARIAESKKMVEEAEQARRDAEAKRAAELEAARIAEVEKKAQTEEQSQHKPGPADSRGGIFIDPAEFMQRKQQEEKEARSELAPASSALPEPGYKSHVAPAVPEFAREAAPASARVMIFEPGIAPSPSAPRVSDSAQRVRSKFIVPRHEPVRPGQRAEVIADLPEPAGDAPASFRLQPQFESQVRGSGSGPLVTADGILERRTLAPAEGVEFALVKDGRTLHYLTARAGVDLHGYAGRRVTVSGIALQASSPDASLLEVSSVTETD